MSNTGVPGVLSRLRDRWGGRHHGDAPEPASTRPSGAPGPAAATVLSGEPSLRCRAPWASLYMDPRGEVKVCCQNEWLRLGNVAERSLLDIWRGDELRRLRERVAADDLSLGCEMCGVAVERGAAESAYFNSFAHLPVTGDESAWPLQLELALSNTCNLQCVMCNGELSSAIRVRREGRPALVSPYGEEFFAELDQFLPHLRAITFLGGEPFLAREATRVMDRLVELGLAPHCSVTTNGTQWNSRIERFIRELPMHIAISIDGTSAATLESVRVGVDHDALMRNVERFRAATAASGGTMGFSYCLMVPTWHELGSVLAWADELDIDVFVNTVHHPPHLSFAHCDLVELERVVEALTAEGAGRGAELGRNRTVWVEQVESLRGLLAQRSSEPGGAAAVVPVSTPVVIGTGAGEGRMSILRADERQLVNEVTPGAAPDFGVDLESLLGTSLWESVRLISRSLGDLQSSQVRRTDDGVEVRDLLFTGPNGHTVVQATMNLGAEAEPTWLLSFERPND